MNLLNNTQIPTAPYPELPDVLETFASEVEAKLSENLLGIYLVGSLASGDFDLDSDVDFLVITHNELTAKNLKRLPEIHTKIHAIDCYPAKHLEGSYISIAELNDAEIVGEKEIPYFDNGSTELEFSNHDNNWHVRWILRERGIPLIGPAPDTLLPPIPSAELFREMQRSMSEILKYFEESIGQPRNFFNSQFGQPFVVLTACRILHTLHTGEVHSKKAGAIWAKEALASEWAAFIEQAWQDREGVRFGVKIGQRAEKKALTETLAFMQYAMQEMNKRIVREGYDKVSHAYRADTLDSSDESYQKYRAWVDELSRHLQDDATVLDLGCGNGIPSTQLLAEKFHVTGVDISPVQIERAKELVPDAQFLCADMSTVTFPPASFDAIVSFYAIIHLPLEEQPSLLAKMHAWLKDDGYLMLITGHDTWTGETANWLGVDGGDMYWSHADRDTYLQWVTEAGFHVEWDRFIPEGESGHTLIFCRKNTII